ncbi:MAG: lysoplasmalogenase [Saprospiraceae bacterium]
MLVSLFSQYQRFSLFFLFIVAAHVASMLHFHDYIVVTKPLIVASLIGFYISTEQKQQNMVLLGLIFALFGDIFLLFDHESFFLLGLISFLLMQWCYIAIFKKDKESITRKKVVFIGILTVFALGMLIYLWPHLGDMKIHVGLYIFSIVTMAIFSMLRKSSLPAYREVVLGAILFLISDTILAINKFVADIVLADYWIMATYIAAQYLIIVGLVAGKSQK